jgi:hypothetical protein
MPEDAPMIMADGFTPDAMLNSQTSYRNAEKPLHRHHAKPPRGELVSRFRSDRVRLDTPVTMTAIRQE